MDGDVSEGDSAVVSRVWRGNTQRRRRPVESPTLHAFVPAECPSSQPAPWSRGRLLCAQRKWRGFWLLGFSYLLPVAAHDRDLDMLFFSDPGSHRSSTGSPRSGKGGPLTLPSGPAASGPHPGGGSSGSSLTMPSLCPLRARSSQNRCHSGSIRSGWSRGGSLGLTGLTLFVLGSMGFCY